MFTKPRISLNRDSLNRSLGVLYVRVFYFIFLGRGVYITPLKETFLWINQSEHLCIGTVQKDSNLKLTFQRAVDLGLNYLLLWWQQISVKTKKKYNSSFSKGALMENILDGIPPLIYCYINHNENRDLPSIK